VAERLQRYLARAGVASRRHAETLISAGRVTVNNQTVTTLGSKVEPGDLVALDGKLVEPPEQVSWYLLYKPSGVVTTLDDPQGRPTISGFLGQVQTRVFPIGRLDWDAEGALLLTDDGAAAHRLLHPSFQVPRTYLAKVKGTPTDEGLARLVSGVRLEDGPARVLEVERFQAAEKNTWLRITVGEGRPHLVKRLCAAIGHPVVRLFRPHQAGISVAGMQPGELRALRPEELRTLEAVAGGQPVPAMTLSLPARRHGRAEEESESDASGGIRETPPPKPPRFGTPPWHAAREQRGASTRAEFRGGPAGGPPPAGGQRRFDRGDSTGRDNGKPGHPRREGSFQARPGGRGFGGLRTGRPGAERPARGERSGGPLRGRAGFSGTSSRGGGGGFSAGATLRPARPGFGRPRRPDEASRPAREGRGFPPAPGARSFGAPGGPRTGRPGSARPARKVSTAGHPRQEAGSFPSGPGGGGGGRRPGRPELGRPARGDQGASRPPREGRRFPARPGGRGFGAGRGRPARAGAASGHPPREGRASRAPPTGGPFGAGGGPRKERPAFERGGGRGRPSGRGGPPSGARGGKPFGKRPAKTGARGWRGGPPSRGQRGPPRPGGGPRRPTR
jgi:23S rRNA pseudouridine2605 synthase